MWNLIGRKSPTGDPYDPNPEEMSYLMDEGPRWNMETELTMEKRVGSVENITIYPQIADMGRGYFATRAKEKDTKPNSVHNKGLAMRSVPTLELIMNS